MGFAGVPRVFQADSKAFHEVQVTGGRMGIQGVLQRVSKGIRGIPWCFRGSFMGSQGRSRGVPRYTKGFERHTTGFQGHFM